MKYRILSVSAVFVAVFAAVSFVSSAASGSDSGDTGSKVASKNIKIGDFSRIEVGQGIKVVFRQASNPGYAEVSASQKNLDRICIKMDGDELEISYKDDSHSKTVALSDQVPTKVVIRSPKFVGADIRSGASLKVVGYISTDNDIEIEGSSAGSASFNTVVCRLLSLDCGSSASVNVKSLKGNLDAETSSAATVKVERMLGKKLEVEASSASSISVLGIRCESVDAEASSAAGITLSGVCASFKKDVSSAASINSRNLAVRKK